LRYLVGEGESEHMEKFLQIIQAQRHDFLNHLQVVSGLLQLNKVERAREYIRQVNTEMAPFSATTRVKIPEVTAALLAGLHHASMFQVALKLTVNSDLWGCSLPGPVAGKAIENMLDAAISAVAAPEAGDINIEVVLEEIGEDCLCRIILPGSFSTEIGRIEKDLAATKNLLQPYHGRLNVIVSPNEVAVILLFPGKK